MPLQGSGHQDPLLLVWGPLFEWENSQNNINLKTTKPDKVDELLIEAEKKEQQSNQIVEYTKEIKKNPMEFRFKIIEILWKIVYSDGSDDNFESNLIRRVCGLLYVSD